MKYALFSVRSENCVMGFPHETCRMHRVHQLSMGMSNDYIIAIEEGATHVRIGTALVGAESGEDG